jgi:hypothetical protein
MKGADKMKQVRILILSFGLFIAGVASVRADWWIETGSGFQSIGGASRLGPYPSKAAADAVNRQYFNGQATVTGSDSPSGGATSGGVYSSDPRVQAAGQIGNAVGNAIGQAIGKGLFGDPQARRNEALNLNNVGNQYYSQGQWNLAVNAYEAALARSPGDPVILQNLYNARASLQQAEQEAMARRKKAEEEAEARRRQGIHDRLAPQLMLSGGSDDNRERLTVENLMLGDSNSEQVGVKGLPGIYLNDTSGKGTDKPYGVPGLPGTYVNGPRDGTATVQSDDSKLQLMMGDDSPPTQQASVSENGQVGVKGLPGIYLNDTTGKGSDKPYGIPGLPGTYVNGPRSDTTQSGETSIQPATGEADTSLTPADSTAIQPAPLTGPQTTIASAPESLQQQARVSQAAAAAPVLEDKAGISRLGFDTPITPNGSAPVVFSSDSHNPTTPVLSGPETEQTAAVPQTLFDKARPGVVDVRPNASSRLDIGSTGTQVINSAAVDVRQPGPNKPIVIDPNVMEVALKLGMHTPENEAVFWCGNAGRSRATKAARDLGEKLLGDTPGGQYLTLHVNETQLSREQSRAVYTPASIAFAKGASGEVHAYIGKECVDCVGCIWALEFKELRQNPKVQKITIDVLDDDGTLIETKTIYNHLSNQ